MKFIVSVKKFEHKETNWLFLVYLQSIYLNLCARWMIIFNNALEFIHQKNIVRTLAHLT